MSENEHIVIDRTETFVKSIFSDFVTVSWLSFCIWLGLDSNFWTLFTGTMFFIFACGKVVQIWKLRRKSFTKKQDLIDWAESLEWSEDNWDT